MVIYISEVFIFVVSFCEKLFYLYQTYSIQEISKQLS